MMGLMSIYRSIGKVFLSFTLIFLIFVLAAPPTVAGQIQSLAPVVAQLTPATKHSNLDQTIAQLLAQYHYSQSKLDDQLSNAILDSYLNVLDSNRSYFLANDIKLFERKYRSALDESLVSGDMQPAYEIFNIYQRRLGERTAHVLKLIRQHKLDFTIDETLELDRKELPWASSQAELNEMWRKRVKHELLALKLAGQDLDEARETLEKRYIGRLRRTAKSNSDDVFQLYMNAVSQTFDPHTAYFSPRTSENFNIQMRLSLEGIGTVLRMEDEMVTVVELVPGGPADLSSAIKPEDKIVAVGQGNKGSLVDVIGWRLDDVVDLIRGPRNTVVRLQVVPAKEGLEHPGKVVRLERDTIKLEKQAASSAIKTFTEGERKIRIGVITIPTFYSDFAAAQRGDKNYRSTTRDVRRILKSLEQAGVEGIVIDLRQNGGGSLQEAIELTGLFIEKGPVVQVRTVDGDVEVEHDPDPTLIYDAPLAVLVDRFSASASEIFAGAIQDYGRGIVLGDPTFGKGTVQTLIDLNRFLPEAMGPAGQLKITVAKFYRINGSSTQHRGVIPDIFLPSAFDSHEVGESAQDNALPWDEIDPTRYRRSQHLASLIPQLKKHHQTRISANPDFAAFIKEIEAAKQARSKTTVSLNEKKRRKEWKLAQANGQQQENLDAMAEGLEPLDADPTLSEDNDQPDLLQDESARIVADLVALLGPKDKYREFVMRLGGSTNP
jgi:carboxyl-terminal processing protease